MKKNEVDTQKPTSARFLPHNRPTEPDTEHPFEQAAKELGKEELVEPKQKELLAAPEDAKLPEPVQNGRLLATYVGLGLERNKDGDELIHLDFSFPLEKVHDGLIPLKVRKAWDWIKSSGNPYVKIAPVPPVTLGIFLDPKEKKPLLKVVGAEFTAAVISVVEETGKGKAKLVTRFKFRLRMDRTEDVVEFAVWKDGREFWLKLEPTQKELDL